MKNEDINDAKIAKIPKKLDFQENLKKYRIQSLKIIEYKILKESYTLKIAKLQFTVA